MRIRLLILLILSCALLTAIELPTPTAVPTISVSLTGFVENPGVYQLSPVNRLSDLLGMNKGLILQANPMLPVSEAPLEKDPQQKMLPVQSDPKKEDKPDYQKLQALRSIQLVRDGKSSTYDLQKFYRLGHIDQNPFLRDGDVVIISAISSLVSISGGINLAGELEFVPGDKLQEIIALAKGFSFDADPSKLQVYRYQANRIDFTLLSLDWNSPDTKQFSLQADDRIVVLYDSQIRTKQRVKLSGQVKNPGEYIISNNTRLYDVLLQAGGLSPRADAKSLVYYSENISGEANPYLDVLMQRSMSDMTPLEYSYLRTNLMQLKGKYSIDAAKLIATEGKEANPLLHDGDHVYIPELMDMVLVSGQVRYPGLVPWVEGQSWDHYIAAAGGYANNRKIGKGRLIRGQSGNWVTPKKNVKIMPGDTVFVPGQIDRSLWTDVKDIVTLSSSVITIIIGLRALNTK